jgi:hypothetical protein
MAGAPQHSPRGPVLVPWTLPAEPILTPYLSGHLRTKLLVQRLSRRVHVAATRAVPNAGGDMFWDRDNGNLNSLALRLVCSCEVSSIDPR